MKLLLSVGGRLLKPHTLKSLLRDRDSRFTQDSTRSSPQTASESLPVHLEHRGPTRSVNG